MRRYDRSAVDAVYAAMNAVGDRHEKETGHKNIQRQMVEMQTTDDWSYGEKGGEDHYIAVHTASWFVRCHHEGCEFSGDNSLL